MPEVTGVVFNLQRFSIHDGPGIRTTVFLTGCPLRCFWCHNPEGLKLNHPPLKPEIQFSPQKCILCGECVAICEHAAHALVSTAASPAQPTSVEIMIHTYDRARCVRCGECVEACCTEAVQFAGKEMTVEGVVAEVLRDRAFYETSGGGVTLSGGEPLLQPGFSRAILEQCKSQGIHTAIETSAHCSWEQLESFLPVVDLVMMDIKHLDSDKHRVATGVPNHRILDNAQRLAATDIPLIFRIPVVPTVNDTSEDVAAIAQFVASLKSGALNTVEARQISLELLPFHRLAGDKYASLGLDYRARDLVTPSKEQMAQLLEVVRLFVPNAIAR